MTAQAASSDDGFRRFEPGGRGVVFVLSIVLSDQRGERPNLALQVTLPLGAGTLAAVTFCELPVGDVACVQPGRRRLAREGQPSERLVHGVTHG